MMLAALSASHAAAYVAANSRQPSGRTAPRMSAQHWMDHLKFGGSTPAFDVLERAQE